MSHLLQLVTELGSTMFMFRYRDCPRSSLNDWFVLNIELIKSCKVYSKGICFFKKLLISGNIGLYLIIN